MDLSDLPSAIDHFNDLLKRAKGKEIVVFLDYDGTLAPIVSRPDMAFMSEETRKAVQEIAMKYTTAIISGRAKRDVKNFVKLDNLYFAGSHGFDIDGPNGINYQIAKEYIPILEHAHDEIVKRTEGLDPGIIIENNLFSLSIHYRLVEEANVPIVKNIVHTTIHENESYNTMLRITHGKKVLEIRPNYAWNKGRAVLHLLDCMDLHDQNKVFAIYVGDDKTDEDAFHALKDTGLGVGIVVTSKEEPHSEVTSAEYFLPKCAQVIDFLHLLAQVPGNL